MTVPVALIAAVAENGVIGRDGEMPWRLSSDLKRFKTLTLGKPVVMGRRTWASLGRPLPGRTNIVVTRDAAFSAEGAVVVGSLAEGLAKAAAAAAEGGAEEIMVIGGGEIYAAALPFAERLYITRVLARPAGDAHFPAIDPADFELVSEEPHAAGEKDSAATVFCTYRRRRPALPQKAPADR